MTVSKNNRAQSEKVKRINCRNCGYRIRSDAEICPHCHVNPQTRKPLPSNLLIAAIVGLVLLFVCVLGAQFLVNPLTEYAGLGLKPPPTAVIQIIYTVATQPPSEAADEPNATPPPGVSAPPKSAPSPTHTAAPPTAARPAPSPTSGEYSAPKLTAPTNNATFSGGDADITLEWSSVVSSGLRENEWYLITLAYTARNGATTTQSGWTRETRWSVKKDWYSDASLAARTFSWNVQLMRVDGADPLTSPTRTPATPQSETRKFVWQ
jgi:hypothetical protein